MKIRHCKFFAAGFLLILFSSCGSTPKNEPAPPEPAEPEYTADPSEAVSIALPPKKERSFFSSINPDALAAVENGSPQSIRAAYSMLRKEVSSYEESEIVLLNVAKSLMQIVWPTDIFNIEVPPVSQPNPYTGAIDSSKQGIYDLSTGNTDFLTTVLPSLVLIVSESRSDYYDLSRMALDNALKQKPDSVLANYLSGMLYRRTGDFDKAVSCFEKAFSGAPDSTEALYALSYCNFKAGKAKVAFEQAKQLLSMNELYRPALKLCAETSFACQDYAASEEYVSRVLQQEPENSYYVLFRAKILVKKGDYIRSASLLDVYARSDTDSRDYLVLRSKIQKEWNRNIAASISTIEKAYSLYPEDEEIILAASQLASDTGSRVAGKTAGELADLILAKDEGNISALEIKINELKNRKNWIEAYNASSVLCSLKNAPSSAIYSHIDICLSAGKKEEAWKIASEQYERDSKDESVLQNYIKVLVSTGRTQEASRLIAQKLPSASSKMKSFLYYQRSFLASGQEAVLVDLRSSLTANPRNKDALFRLYEIYFDKKEYRKAQYYLKQVVALSPNDDSLLKLNSELESFLIK